mgnify:CR=1 FL=1
MYKLAKLKVDGLWYDLSDIERDFDEETLIVGSSSRSVTGRLQVREMARKKRFTFGWGCLRREGVEDAGAGADRLMEWAGQMQTCTLRLFRSQSESVDYEVYIARANRRLVRDMSGREYWEVELELEEV